MNEEVKINKLIGMANKPRHSEFTESQLETLNRAAEIGLAIIAAAGIATIALVAPNLLQAIYWLFSRKGSGKLSMKAKQRKTAQVFYYLKRSGLIKLKPDKGDFRILLTNAGKRKLEKIKWNLIKIPKPSSWNGRWWQIAADIPTKSYRRAADTLRKKLKELGFFPLQRTLWLHPYDPRGEIQFIIDSLGISKFVTVMEISRLDQEDEALIKKYFREKDIF